MAVSKVNELFTMCMVGFLMYKYELDSWINIEWQISHPILLSFRT